MGSPQQQHYGRALIDPSNCGKNFEANVGNRSVITVPSNLHHNHEQQSGIKQSSIKQLKAQQSNISLCIQYYIHELPKYTVSSV